MTLSFTHFSCSTFAPSTLSIWLSCNKLNAVYEPFTWWCHQIETFSALLAICAGNSPVTGEFPAQRPVTRSFNVFFDLRLNKRLSKQWWGWRFETFDVTLMREADLEHFYLFTWNWIESWIGYIQSHNKSAYYEYEVRVSNGKSIVYGISLFDNKLCQNSLLLTFLLT